MGSWGGSGNSNWGMCNSNWSMGISNWGGSNYWSSNWLNVDIRLGSDLDIDVGLSSNFLMDIRLGIHLDIDVGLGSDLFMDIRFSKRVEVGIGYGGVIMSGIDSSNWGGNGCNWLSSVSISI